MGGMRNVLLCLDWLLMTRGNDGSNHDDCIRVVFVVVLPPTLLTSDLRLNEIIFLDFALIHGDLNSLVYRDLASTITCNPLTLEL